jgi:hypothetical protein
MSNVETSEDICKNFHLFWDNFPFPVMLIRKDRTIIDVNKAGLVVGYPVGVKCRDIGDKKLHAGCKADKALRERAGIRDVAYLDLLDKVLDSYWVPLADSNDIYVHFAIDITEYAADRLFPKKIEQSGCDCSN